jgi:hypothetical protein
MSFENQVSCNPDLITLLLIEVVNRRDQGNIVRKVFVTLLDQLLSCQYLLEEYNVPNVDESANTSVCF